MHGNLKAGRNSLGISMWTALHYFNTFFLFIRILSYWASNTQQDTHKLTSFSQPSVNFNEHMSIWDSLQWKLSSVFLIGSCHIAITKSIYKMYILIFHIGKCKRHIHSLVIQKHIWQHKLTALLASLSANGALAYL
jgi:hypothetical protein